MLCNWSSSFFQSAGSLTNSSRSHYHSHDALESPHIQYIQKWPYHLCSPFNLLPPPTEPANPHLKTCTGPQRFFPKWKKSRDQGKNWLCPYPHIQAVWAKCPQSPLISLFRQWLPVLTLEDGAGSGPPLGAACSLPPLCAISPCPIFPFHRSVHFWETGLGFFHTLFPDTSTNECQLLHVPDWILLLQESFLVRDLAWILLTILIASFLSLWHASV